MNLFHECYFIPGWQTIYVSVVPSRLGANREARGVGAAIHQRSQLEEANRNRKLNPKVHIVNYFNSVTQCPAHTVYLRLFPLDVLCDSNMERDRVETTDRL